MPTSPPDAADAGNKRLQTRIDEFNEFAGRPYRLSMSFGVELLAETAESSLEELLSRADQAMYERKRENERQRESAGVRKSEAG